MDSGVDLCPAHNKQKLNGVAQEGERRHEKLRHKKHLNLAGQLWDLVLQVEANSSERPGNKTELPPRVGRVVSGEYQVHRHSGHVQKDFCSVSKLQSCELVQKRVL